MIAMTIAEIAAAVGGAATGPPDTLVTGPAFVAYARPSLADPIWVAIVSRFYILASIPLAIVIGVGASWLLATSQRLGRRQPRVFRFAEAGVGIALMALVTTSAAAHVGLVDQRNNAVAHDYGSDVLATLEPRALLFMAGDKVTFPVSYLQLVERYRPDVIAVDMADLTRPTYVDQLRKTHPDLSVPFKAHVDVRTLIALFEANIESRAVYMTFAPTEPEFWSRFDLVRAGLVERVLPKGLGKDRYALLREKAEAFSHLRYPARSFPIASYEYRMAHDYGALAFDMGYVVAKDDEKEAMYRTAIRLAPDLPLAYKNLGVVLLRGKRRDTEVSDLWEHYLAMNPRDPGVAVMRREIDSLRRTTSSDGNR